MIRRKWLPALIVTLSFAVGGVPLTAAWMVAQDQDQDAQDQDSTESSAQEETQEDQAEGTLPEAWMDAVRWRSIGPASMMGRITSLSIYEENSKVWWAATASGGLLKTTNDGMTLEHQFDHEATVSIGDVQVCQSDPNIVWVGTGEANPRNSVSWGNGVYKSTDGGDTWTHMGLDKTFQIGRIAIDPTNPDTVYVGAMGRLWGPSEERGVYKTTDGGETWEKVFYVDDKTGVIDVQMHPTDSNTLIIAAYERKRDGFDGNDPEVKYGEGAGIFKTTDGGENWTELEAGLPTVNKGRIGLTYYRKDPNYIYAVVESELIGQPAPDMPHWGFSVESADVGMRITELEEEGPGETAGLQADDIILSVDGEMIANNDQLLDAFLSKTNEDSVELKIYREEEEQQITLQFAERPQGNRGGGGGGRGQRGGGRGGRGGGGGVSFVGTLGGQNANQQRRQGPKGYEHGGIYRSSDGGDTWERINTLNPRPMYYSQIRVDPSDNNRIWLCGTSLYRSNDGGETFTGDGLGRGDVHVDNHALWIDPNDGDHIILGNDGGIYITKDWGENWDHQNHVAIGQFYHVGVSADRDYWVFGGLQDNGTWGGPHRVGGQGGPVNSDWISINGGDGFIAFADPNDSKMIYAESQNGNMSRYNIHTGERSSVRPRGNAGGGRGGGGGGRGGGFRFNWKTPFILSPHNSKIHYSAGNYVFRSVAQGDGARPISPEITNSDNGAGSAISESAVREGVLYVGTTDGSLWVTTDGGENWTDLWENPDDVEAPAGGGGGGGRGGFGNFGGGQGQFGRGGQGRGQFAGRGGQGGQGRQGRGGQAAANPVNGAWTASFEIQGQEREFTMRLRMDDENEITGDFDSEAFVGDLTGSYDPESNEITLETETASIVGKIENNTFTGTLTAGDGAFEIEFSATRAARAGLAQGRGRGQGGRGGRGGAQEDEGESIASQLPGRRWVSSLEASKHQAGRAYATFDGHRSNDDEPHVYVTENYGRTWKSIRANLPTGAGSTRVIREDIENPNLLFLGCEFSCWVSIDRGESWTRFNSNLPTVAVHEFAIHPSAGEVVAGTHGRSLWITDVSMLRQMTPETVAADVHLYRPHPAIMWKPEPRKASSGTRRFVGENPPTGSLIYYSLAEAAEEVSLTVSDISGDEIAQLEGSTEPGLHRVNWTLRRGGGGRGGRGNFGGGRGGGRGGRGGRGPAVSAGDYLLTLTVDGETYTQPLKVEGDPNYPDMDTAALINNQLMYEAFEQGEEDEEVGGGDAAESKSSELTPVTSGQ